MSRSGRGWRWIVRQGVPGAVALQALNLLIARQLVLDVERIRSEAALRNRRRNAVGQRSRMAVLVTAGLGAPY
ncbi:MAG: hypothetical protein ACE5FA_05840 [Dehalococcoidia bacterium]